MGGREHMKFILRSTDEYERLTKFFAENGLEFDGEEEVDTDVVKCWKVTQASSEDLQHIQADTADGGDFLVAGCVLALREGKYIIDGIAVDKTLRKFGIGKLLVGKVKEEVKKLGGSEIYLVARAPGFFRTLGFETIDADKAPNFFECKYCPQYGKECHPEIMKLCFDCEQTGERAQNEQKQSEVCI